MDEKEGAVLVKKEVPTLVKILAVLGYIGAGICILGGLIILLGGGIIGSVLSTSPELAALGIFGSALFVVAGIFVICFAILDIFIDRGLWVGKNWARILEIIFSCLGILGSLLYFVNGQIVSGVIQLLISGLIGGYLLFNKKVKEAFKK